MKILTPVDQSRRDGIVLPYCVRMAKALDASIALVHVVSLTRSIMPGALREAEAYVTAVADGLREEGLTVEGVAQRGDPAAVIVAIANQLQVDMIVMVTRGRKGLGKLVVGSVADAVLASCEKPVLLLSEAANGGKVDEKTQLQSAYVATFVWQRQLKGLYTPEEAEHQLDRLARAGLDRGTLFETYRSHQERGSAPAWVDIDFQLDTLREFLPEALPESSREKSAKIRKIRAA